MVFLKIYKERRDIPETNVLTSNKKPSNKRKIFYFILFILLIYGYSPSCLLKYGSRSMSS